jgi:hypothetical protein
MNNFGFRVRAECLVLTNVSANIAVVIFKVGMSMSMGMSYPPWKWQLQCLPKRWLTPNIWRHSHPKAEVKYVYYSFRWFIGQDAQPDAINFEPSIVKLGLKLFMHSQYSCIHATYMYSAWRFQVQNFFSLF